MQFIKHAKPADESVACVDAKVKDTKGATELSTLPDGPILVARLPAGHCTIAATHNGTARVRDVTIAANKPKR